MRDLDPPETEEPPCGCRWLLVAFLLLLTLGFGAAYRIRLGSWPWQPRESPPQAKQVPDAPPS